MATITLNIPATTFVSSALPDTNFSSYPLVYSGTDTSFQNCISFLQITLPVLPVTSVDSAILELSVIVKSGTAPSPLVVNRVTDPFTTATVTYHTRPAFVATPSVIDIKKEDLYTTVRIDVTALITSWLNGTYPNNGMALTNSDGTSVVALATNSINYEPFDPRLVITYTPVKPDTALCFSYAQLAHLIEQLITLYPTSTLSVFLTGFSPSAITGTPYQLYVSPEGTYGMLFILLDTGQQEVIPLNAIAAIYTGDGTVYDPAITYLPPPQFPDGCDKNLITAYHDYVPVSTEVQMYLGSIVSASGMVYKNEYGLIVLSDADGNTPVFIPVLNITSIFPVSPVSPNSAGKKAAALPRITVTNKS